MLIEREGAGGWTRVLIDASPDMRAQLLATEIGVLDGVVLTHSHADHVHGLDDLRMIVFNTRRRLRVWADAPTQSNLLARFSYAFVQPEGSDYPPILDLENIDGDIRIDGPGGDMVLTPVPVQHGRIPALGFRIEDLCYLPDVSDIPEASWPLLDGLDCWVLDALRLKPHPSHAHLERSLEWIARAAPRYAVLTNMHIDMDYDEVNRGTPDNVVPAFDGMTIEYEITP